MFEQILLVVIKILISIAITIAIVDLIAISFWFLHVTHT